MATKKTAKKRAGEAAKAAKAVAPGRVARVRIEGFKSIAKQTIELGRLNVLIGANGSGKTAVLEAMGVLGAAVEGRLDAGDLMRRGVRPSTPRVFMTALTDEPPDAIQLAAEWADGESFAVALATPSEGEQHLPWSFRETKLLRAEGNRPRILTGADAQVYAARDHRPGKLMSLSDFVIYDPKTPTLRGLSPDPFQQEPLGLHGGGLAQAIKALQTPDGGLGPLARDELLSLLDWASGIEIGPSDPTMVSPVVPMTNEIVRFVDRRMTAGRNVISAFDASEGALYVLFALTLLFHPHVPLFFGVEGLDHALHPRLARALIRTMGEHVGATDKQIVLTTHNPLVLDGLDLANDEVRLFTVDRAESGETVIHRVEHTEALRKAKASGATMSQMWLQGLFGAVPDLW